jgi:hypothetical protein
MFFPKTRSRVSTMLFAVRFHGGKILLMASVAELPDMVNAARTASGRPVQRLH